jgi:integrase
MWTTDTFIASATRLPSGSSRRGVPIEIVSVLLGHSNIAITLKHYRPWVKSLQDKLEAAVIQAWA